MTAAGMREGVEARIVEVAGATQELREAWTSLAAVSKAPYSHPGWLLSWCRHAASGEASPRLIVVEDEDGLVSVLPFYLDSVAGLRRLRLMAAGLSVPLTPACRPGFEGVAAAAAARLLDDFEDRPDVVELEGVPAEGVWIEAFERAWSDRGSVRRYVDYTREAPGIALGRDYGAWLGSKSQNFRGQVRRWRNRIVKGGGRVVIATEEDLPEKLRDFFSLHHARWDGRGGSDALDVGVEAMILAAGESMVPGKNFLLSYVEMEDRVVAAALFLSAGDEIAFWNSGFDDSFSAYSPALAAIAAAVEHAADSGQARFDLGYGDQGYKKRFADHSRTLVWTTLLPPGPRRPWARAALAPRRVRRAVSERFTEEQKARLKERVGSLRPKKRDRGR